jgi:hypothetical protein
MIALRKKCSMLGNLFVLKYCKKTQDITLYDDRATLLIQVFVVYIHTLKTAASYKM